VIAHRRVAVAAAAVVLVVVLIGAYLVGSQDTAPTASGPAAPPPAQTEVAEGYPMDYRPAATIVWPTPTLDARPVTFGSSPYGGILATLGQELDRGDTAALAARSPVSDTGSRRLTAVEAGMIEGGIALGAADARRILDDFYAAGSTPRIDGYFVRTFEGASLGSACIGVVTRGWSGTVPSPTEPPLPAGTETYGQSWPADFPAGWWGWQLCTGDGAQWSWDDWVCFGPGEPGAGDEEIRGGLRDWRDYVPWNEDAAPGAGDANAVDSWVEPTYYVLE
jgi:hypothetical protein